MQHRLFFCVIGFALPILVGMEAAMAGTVTLEPRKDNTLYEDPTGSLSNGAGSQFFTGRVYNGDLRRGLIAFDLSVSVPSDATIQGVTLTLRMNRTHDDSGNTTVGLHRALTDWGEGSSDAPSEEGEGDAAAPGDATWLHTFYDTDFWTAQGGDFEATPSASTDVKDVGLYVWGSTPGMVADVQSWLNSPSTNYGWAIVGDESGAAPTSKRFYTKENVFSEIRPKLTVHYMVGIPAVTEWGIATMTLLTLTAGTVVFGRMRGRSTVAV